MGREGRKKGQEGKQGDRKWMERREREGRGTGPPFMDPIDRPRHTRLFLTIH